MKDYYKTEMYSAAEYFIDDIENGNITLAYHHSKYASDHASQCGMTEAALMFGNMANRVLSGDMGMDMAEQVKNYVESGAVPPDTATGNIAEPPQLNVFVSQKAHEGLHRLGNVLVQQEYTNYPETS